MNLNLWENQPGDQPDTLSATTLKRGSMTSQRRVEAAVLSSLRGWLLDDYAAAYCRSLRSTPLYRRCYLIDAWGLASSTTATPATGVSGEPAQSQQRTRKNKTEKTLPPLLQPVARLSQALADECPQRPFALHGILLAAPAKNGGQENKSQPAFPKEGGIVQASWRESATALLAAIEQAPAIFLLDPLAGALFTHDDLAPLYQRTTAPTELCLLIAHKQLERRITSALHTPDEAAALTALLRSDRWKTFLSQQNQNEAPAPVDGVIDLLCAAIQKHMPFVQRISVPLIRQAAVIEDAPYTLLFATRRKDSLVCMNDAVCLHRRRLEEASHRGLLSESWFAAQLQERLAQETRALYEEVVQTGRKQRARRWPDLRQQLLLAHFGRFTLSEYDAIIQQLLREGIVRCQWRQRGQETGDILPGAEDVLLWL